MSCTNAWWVPMISASLVRFDETIYAIGNTYHFDEIGDLEVETILIDEEANETTLIGNMGWIIGGVPDAWNPLHRGMYDRGYDLEEQRRRNRQTCAQCEFNGLGGDCDCDGSLSYEFDDREDHQCFRCGRYYGAMYDACPECIGDPTLIGEDEIDDDTIFEITDDGTAVLHDA